MGQEIDQIPAIITVKHIVFRPAGNASLGAEITERNQLAVWLGIPGNGDRKTRMVLIGWQQLQRGLRSYV